MKIVNLSQRSPQWLQWRRGGVTASEAGIILGSNPYKTCWRLWAEKTGRALAEDLSKNPLVMRGIRLEDRARQCCETVLGEDFLLPVCAESRTNSRARASFDGITAARIPTELKCPCPSQWNLIVVEGESSDAFRFYYPQVQQQIFVAEAPYGWLMFYSPANNGDHQIFKVPRDAGLIAELEEGIDRFWELILKDRPPALDLERDLYIPAAAEADDWNFYAMDYRLADQQIRKLENNMAMLKRKRGVAQEAMQNMMGAFCKAEFAGVSVTRFKKQGGVEYSRFLKENYPNVTSSTLDMYRKKPSTQVRVTVTNQAMPRNIVDPEIRQRLPDVCDGELKSMFF